jgi:hypothetical protein
MIEAAATRRGSLANDMILIQNVKYHTVNHSLPIIVEKLATGSTVVRRRP